MLTLFTDLIDYVAVREWSFFFFFFKSKISKINPKCPCAKDSNESHHCGWSKFSTSCSVNSMIMSSSVISLARVDTDFTCMSYPLIARTELSHKEFPPIIILSFFFLEVGRPDVKPDPGFQAQLDPRP